MGFILHTKMRSHPTTDSGFPYLLKAKLIFRIGRAFFCEARRARCGTRRRNKRAAGTEISQQRKSRVMAKKLQDWLKSEVQPFRGKSIAWISQHHFFRDRGGRD